MSAILLFAYVFSFLSVLVHAVPVPGNKVVDTTSYTKSAVVATTTGSATSTITTVISTSITKKGTYTFPHSIVLTVKSAPTKVKTTTYWTTVVPYTSVYTYTTKIPIIPSTTSTLTAATANTKPLSTASSPKPSTTANCNGVEGSASDSYFVYGIGDYYESIPDAKTCSQKCALFADCVAFEYLPLADLDPNYPQNCWLYTELPEKYVTPDTTGLRFYHQECFAQVNVPALKTYPKDKVCGITGSNPSSYGRTMIDEIFTGSVDACAQHCLSKSNCQVYQYSEIEFLDGNNCHIYSGALPSEYQQYAGQPVTPVGTTTSYRWIYERGCAA